MKYVGGHLACESKFLFEKEDGSCFLFNDGKVPGSTRKATRYDSFDSVECFVSLLPFLLT